MSSGTSSGSTAWISHALGKYMVPPVLALSGCSTLGPGEPVRAAADQQPNSLVAGDKRMASDSAAPAELLFDLDLNYREPIELAPIGEKVGELVGGGDGILTGPRISGSVRWLNYETTGQDEVCSLRVPGIVRTQDGAEIQFEGRELAMPFADGSKKWKVAGVMRFKTEDVRYNWLNETLALTNGTFDYGSGHARWSAHAAK